MSGKMGNENKCPTNPIPASFVSLAAGVFRSPNFFPPYSMQSLSRGDAPGYVEGGLWPKKGAVNAGAELIAVSSMIRRQRVEIVSYVIRRRST